MQHHPLICQIELARDCHEETAALQRASWSETFGTQGDGEMHLDMNARLSAEQSNQYVLAVSRDIDGNAVGLCGFWIYWAKLKSAQYAMNDIIYIANYCRHNGNARQLWDCAVDELLRRKVLDIRIAAPMTSPASFFSGLGLKPRSVNYGRNYTQEEADRALA